MTTQQIRIYYDDRTGKIEYQAVADTFAPSLFPWIQIPERVKINEWRVDLATSQLVPEVTQVLTRPTDDWATQRRTRYGSVDTQLNLLWDDIHAGHLGESAKNSTWYQSILKIKNQIPRA